MPLHIGPENWHSPQYSGERTIHCDGCGLSMNFKGERWVFPVEQVNSWIDEHADHEPKDLKPAQKRAVPK